MIDRTNACNLYIHEQEGDSFVSVQSKHGFLFFFSTGTERVSFRFKFDSRVVREVEG